MYSDTWVGYSLFQFLYRERWREECCIVDATECLVMIMHKHAMIGIQLSPISYRSPCLMLQEIDVTQFFSEAIRRNHEGIPMAPILEDMPP